MKELLIVICLLVASSVQAHQTCVGKLQFVSLNPVNGYVQFNYGYGTQYHCSVNQEFNSVNPASCKAIYSMLLAARLAGKSIQARYNGDFTCSIEELGHEQQTKRTMYRIQIID